MGKRAQDRPPGRCEIRSCICANRKPGRVRVNENIGDGSYAVMVCQPAAKLLRLNDGDDLPDAETVRKKIRAAKRGRVRK